MQTSGHSAPSATSAPIDIPLQRRFSASDVMATPDQSPRLNSSSPSPRMQNLPLLPSDQLVDPRDALPLTVFPREFAFQVARSNKGMIARTLLTNRSLDKAIGFKFKTNAPGRFSVSPVLGIVFPQTSVEVYVRSQTSEFMPNDSFMVETVDLLPQETESLSPLAWRQISASRIHPVYLACRPPTQPSQFTPPASPLSSHILPPPSPQSVRMPGRPEMQLEKTKSDAKRKSPAEIVLAPLVLLRVLLYAVLMWVVRVLVWPIVGGRLDEVIEAVKPIAGGIVNQDGGAGHHQKIQS